MNGHHRHHGNNGRGTGQDKGRAVGARDTTCLEPLGMFLFFSFLFLSTKLLFTFRTTAMSMNGPATTSRHLKTSKQRQRQQLQRLCLRLKAVRQTPSKDNVNTKPLVFKFTSSWTRSFPRKHRRRQKRCCRFPGTSNP
jgi:hypothetical protein